MIKERLTKRGKNGKAYLINYAIDTQMAAVQKLAEYEEAQSNGELVFKKQDEAEVKKEKKTGQKEKAATEPESGIKIEPKENIEAETFDHLSNE